MESKRNQSLDGLRAIAVLMVLLYHHGLLNLGWAGVDIFFVLSGYLITTILRRQRDAQDFWRSYWTKRALRILPPLVLVLALTAALGFSLNGLQALAYLLSFGDILAYLRPGFEPLRPLWSLAVEEHFYLLWPFAIRYCNRSVLLGALIALMVVEPLARGIATLHTHQWEFVYFLTPFRLDGLAAGCLLALLLEKQSTGVGIARWCVPAGVACSLSWLVLRVALGNAFTRDNPTVAYNSMCYTLVALVSVCVLAHLLARPSSPPARLLSSMGLPQLGLVSYGMYLYQVPVHQAVASHFPALGRVAILVDAPLTLLLAALSYYAVERPIMKLGRRAAVLPQAVRVPRELQATVLRQE